MCVGVLEVEVGARLEDYMGGKTSRRVQEVMGVGTGSERGHSIILYILRPSYKRR